MKVPCMKMSAFPAGTVDARRRNRVTPTERNNQGARCNTAETTERGRTGQINATNEANNFRSTRNIRASTRCAPSEAGNSQEATPRASPVCEMKVRQLMLLPTYSALHVYETKHLTSKTTTNSDPPYLPTSNLTRSVDTSSSTIPACLIPAPSSRI